MHYRNLLWSLLIVAGMAGCAAPGETAVVTERPAAPTEQPSAEPSAPKAPAMPEATAAASPLDTVQVQRFDAGKMWTFDNPPMQYFSEAYGFQPDQKWFESARLGALRFATYCSASFISPNGLIMTNHHCGRESISEVSAEGEGLLEEGFLALSVGEERKVKDLFVDQLQSITDVTAEVQGAARTVKDDEARAQALADKIKAVEDRMTAAAKGRDSTLQVQVIELYNGGRYSAYTFKRYSDIRLVMAPELQLGFYGGDPDNFTYPRYALDMSFFRAYGPDGKPLQTTNYFKFSPNGAADGEAVFVVGNPGSTSRLNTVSQLAFERDYTLPLELRLMHERADALLAFIEANPEQAEKMDLRNEYFSISNSIKANTGQLEGLRDPYLIARRQAAENRVLSAINATDSLRERYGRVPEQLQELQAAKAAAFRQSGALAGFGSPQIGSRILLRGLYGYIHSILQQRGAPEARVAEVRKEAMKLKDWPKEVEQQVIAQTLAQLERSLGASDATVRRLLGGRTPEQVAADVVAKTALADTTGFGRTLDKNYLNSADATVPLIEAMAPLFFTINQQEENLRAREDRLSEQLALARFAVEGTTAPPDASFSLRLADGVVAGYAYNGTLAPPFTTFYGLYNNYYSHKGERDWALPERWLERKPELELKTPFNFVMTNDIIGGNSGSPVINKNLEVVGLVFDGNIESLPNNYLFREVTARAVAVDSRGIVEALDAIYDADRLVLEIRSGRLAQTEQEAEQALK